MSDSYLRFSKATQRYRVSCERRFDDQMTEPRLVAMLEYHLPQVLTDEQMDRLIIRLDAATKHNGIEADLKLLRGGVAHERSGTA